MTHSTPPEAVRQTVVEHVAVAGRTYEIERPTGTDQLFDHPAVRSNYAKDEYIPYWSELWPAARMLADAIAREPWAGGEDALEVACGLGLSGIVALGRGLHVTFTDIDELAVTFAAANARRNGFTRFRTAALDLRQPPEDRYPVILGSDLLYEPRMVEPVIAFLHATLAPDGFALLADPNRVSARPFRWAAEQAGLRIEATPVRVGTDDDGTDGTVYRVRLPGNARLTHRAT